MSILQVFPNANERDVWERIICVELIQPNRSLEDRMKTLNLGAFSIMSYLGANGFTYTFQDGNQPIITIPCVNDSGNVRLRDFLKDPSSPLRQHISTVLNEEFQLRIVCATLKELSIVLGPIASFYSKSFEDPEGKFKSEWNDNRFLRRFVRRLRDWAIIDYSCLLECQAKYQCKSEASIYCKVWETPILLRNVESNVILNQTSEVAVFRNLKSNSFLKGYNLPFVRKLFTAVKSMQLPFRCPKMSESLMLYLVNLMRRGACADIQPSSNCSSVRKEDMLGSSIYTPLIQEAIGLQIHGNKKSDNSTCICIPMTELNLEMFPSYTSPAFADISWCGKVVNGKKSDIVPFLLGEYATEHVPVKRTRFQESQPDDYLTMLGQKDVEKLVASLSSCFLNILDRLTPLSLEEKREVRVWGALFYNLTVQFLQLRLFVPDQVSLNNGKIEFLLFTEREWCISLQPTYTMPMTDPCAFVKSLLRVWDISTVIANDFMYLSTLLENVADYEPMTHFVFANPPAKMPESQKSTTTFETPNPQRTKYQNREMNEKDETYEIPTSVSEDYDPRFVESGKVLQKRVLDVVQKSGYSLLKMVKTWTHPQKSFQFLVQNETTLKSCFVVVKPLHGRSSEEEQFLNKIRSAHVVKPVSSEVVLHDKSSWLILIMPQLFEDKYEHLESVSSNPLAYFGTLLQMAMDAMLGAMALHKAGILHRDLKPPHLLRDRDAKKWVIIDLDCSVELNQAQNYLTVDDINVWPLPPGTEGFRAPEITRRQQYGFAADVFSLGTTFIYIYTKSRIKQPMDLWPSCCIRAESSLRQVWSDMTLEDPFDRLPLKQAHRRCADILESLQLDQMREKKSDPLPLTSGIYEASGSVVV